MEFFYKNKLNVGFSLDLENSLASFQSVFLMLGGYLQMWTVQDL